MMQLLVHCDALCDSHKCCLVFTYQHIGTVFGDSALHHCEQLLSFKLADMRLMLCSGA